MTDAAVSSMVRTPDGELSFQDYFVRRRCEPTMLGLRLAGIENAGLPGEVRQALADPHLQGVILCPSNPYVSLGPILSVPGMREQLQACRAPIIAVSPIVAGHSLKGPAAKMMKEQGVQTVSALAVGRLYGDLIDALLVDETDRALVQACGPDDAPLHPTSTVMRSTDDRLQLARECMHVLSGLGVRPRRRHRKRPSSAN